MGEANITPKRQQRESDSNESSKRAGVVKPSVLASISKFLSTQAHQVVRYGWSILLRF
jgi:hypothetical protein